MDIDLSKRNYNPKHRKYILVIASAFMCIALAIPRSRDRVDDLAGCYQRLNNMMASKIILDESGYLHFHGEAVKASVTWDKSGLSLLPSKKVVIGQDGEPVIENGFPYLIAIDKSGEYLTIPSEVTQSSSFKKTC